MSGNIFLYTKHLVFLDVNFHSRLIHPNNDARCLLFCSVLCCLGVPTARPAPAHVSTGARRASCNCLCRTGHSRSSICTTPLCNSYGGCIPIRVHTTDFGPKTDHSSPVVVDIPIPDPTQLATFTFARRMLIQPLPTTVLLDNCGPF